MTENYRFDAALRARSGYRPAPDGLDRPRDPTDSPASPEPAAAPLRIASELEASLIRDLNALAAGLRPPPKKLLPEKSAKTPLAPGPSIVKAGAGEPAGEETVSADGADAGVATAKPRSPYAPARPPGIQAAPAGAIAAARVVGPDKPADPPPPVSASAGVASGKPAPTSIHDKSSSPYAPPSRAARRESVAVAVADAGGRGRDEPTSPPSPAGEPAVGASLGTAGAIAAEVTAPVPRISVGSASPYAPPSRVVSAAGTGSAVLTDPVKLREPSTKPPSPYAPVAKQTPAKPLAAAGSPAEAPLASEKPVGFHPSPSQLKSQDEATSPATQASNAAAAVLERGGEYFFRPKRPLYPGPAAKPERQSAGPDTLSADMDVPVAPLAGAGLPQVRADDIAPASVGPGSPDEPAGAATPSESIAEETIDSPSPEEIARLYAPAAYARARLASVVADDAPERHRDVPESPYAPSKTARRAASATPAARNPAGSNFAPRSGRRGAPGSDGVKLRPIRWQARDEPAPGSIRSWSAGLSWKGKAAAALVLIALVGGAATVVTLESLPAPAPGGGVAAVDRTPAAEQAAAAKGQPTKKLASAGAARSEGAEIVHADDAGGGLAPSDGSLLPRSAKVIPLPQPVHPAAGAGLRPTRDMAMAGDPKLQGDGKHKAAAVTPADSGGGSAASGSGSDDAAAPEGQAGPIASGGDPGAPLPGASLRSGHNGSAADGVLAYAPAPEIIDRGAKALVKKGERKPAAAAGSDLGSGSARVTSWVNMRASADNKAATVKVLQAGSIVTVVQCKFWCEIVSDGKHGFVYKRFLAASEQNAAAQ